MTNILRQNQVCEKAFVVPSLVGNASSILALIGTNSAKFNRLQQTSGVGGSVGGFDIAVAMVYSILCGQTAT